MEIIVVGPGGEKIVRAFSALGSHAAYITAVSQHTADDTYWEEVDLLYLTKGAVRQYGDSVKEMMRLARVYGTFVFSHAESETAEKIDNVDFFVVDSERHDDVWTLSGVKVRMYPSVREVQVQSGHWNGTILLSEAAHAEVAIITFVDQLLRGKDFEVALQTAGNRGTKI